MSQPFKLLPTYMNPEEDDNGEEILVARPISDSTLVKFREALGFVVDFPGDKLKNWGLKADRDSAIRLSTLNADPTEATQAEIDTFLSVHEPIAREYKESIIRNRLKTETPADTIYQTLAGAMTLNSARTLLFLLARRTPLEEMLAQPDSPRDIMLYVADRHAKPTANIVHIYGDRRIPSTPRWKQEGIPGAELVTELAKWVELYGADPVQWVKDGCNMEWTSKYHADLVSATYILDAFKSCF